MKDDQIGALIIGLLLLLAGFMAVWSVLHTAPLTPMDPYNPRHAAIYEGDKP